MKLAFFLLCLIFCASTYAAECTVNLYSKVYRLDSRQPLGSRDIILKSDCELSVAERLAQIVSSATGTIGVDFLKRELAREFPEQNINIFPRKISLLELNNALRDNLTANSNLYFFDTKSLNGVNSVGLQEEEVLRPACEVCHSFGERNIKIDIVNTLSSSMRTLWFSSRILAKVKVFKAKRNISFQQKHLEAEDFYADEIYTMSPDNIVTSIENIKFYKANKTLLQGSPVSNLDLQAVNLISYGIPVQVILKNNNISLSRTALPVRSAFLGETVELKNPANNKVIAGKVVDYNKVVIEI